MDLKPYFDRLHRNQPNQPNPRNQPSRLGNPVLLVCVGLLVLAGGIVANNRAHDTVVTSVERSQREAALSQASSSTSTSTSAPGHSVRRAGDAYDGGVGFVVPYRPDCPPGAERQGDPPPVGFKEWCVRVGIDQGLKHGWYSEWYPDGRPSRSGAYEDGLRTGVWTRWYPSGKKRVQAEFARGLQHGKLISWDRTGNQLGEQLFRDGSAVKQNRR